MQLGKKSSKLVTTSDNKKWLEGLICPRCKGLGNIEKYGNTEWEYDSHFPCPQCVPMPSDFSDIERLQT